MVETWPLRVLVEVDRRGSFSAAAEALAMSQPAVSRQIAALERRFGVPLFRRMPRGVRSTAAGAEAARLARDVLDRLLTMESRLATYAELTAGELRLCAFPSANTFLVPEAIRRFSAAHPGVTLSLVQRDPARPLSAVRDGQIDLALVTEWDLYADRHAAKYAVDRSDLDRVPLDGLDLVPLLDEELQLALPAGHRLARQARVRLRELPDEVWIEGAHPDCLGPIPPLADALGGPPRIAFTCDDWHGKQALVAAGAGVMLVPTLARPAIRRDLVLRPTSPALPARRVYAVAATARSGAPAVAAMLTLLAGLAVAEQVRPAHS
jgi:DNA-binding transcriptional LysR family regulator